MIGRAWLRYWPFDQFGVLPAPTQPAAPTTPGTERFADDETVMSRRVPIACAATTC